jgi:hypothetical protein
MTPTILHPETGKSEAVSYQIANGSTAIDLELAPSDAIFVVFSGTATGNSLNLPKKELTEVTSVQGEWNITFQPQRGAPASAKLNELKSWTESNDAGIKYFSGTATYQIDIDVAQEWIADDKDLIIALGDVGNLAEVIVNGESQGTAWKKPFDVVISDAVKPGKNMLEIKVTNLWVNRLIGDAQPGVSNKITYTTMNFYQPNSKLLSAGLLGPVKLLSRSRR